jgi:predicted DNA-binding protein
MDMETLTKKTTILFPPGLHRRLTSLAEQKGTSLGELVRSACEHEYGAAPVEERVAAVRRMTGLALPVASVRRMKRESVPDAGMLAP